METIKEKKSAQTVNHENQIVLQAMRHGARWRLVLLMSKIAVEVGFLSAMLVHDPQERWWQ